MTAPGFSHAEADLRAHLAALGELEMRQQAKELGARFALSPGDVRSMWRQEQKGQGATGSGSKLAGRPIGELLKPADAWPEPVDAGGWLEECEDELRRYLAMPEGAHLAVAAWCLYTHAAGRFGYAPYLIATSPAPECGKTTVLRVCRHISSLPLVAGSMTVATLFRVMDEHHPVLLCDEQDGRLERNEELRLLLNEGFQRGSVVLRCVGDDSEPRAFNTFGPKALASIGELPPTVVSRSIVLRMERSRRPLAPLDPLEEPEALVRLRRQAARWAADHASELGEVPDVPGMGGRLRDKWGPLLAVAEAAGGDWLERVAVAAQALHFDGDEQPEHLELLADVGQILASLAWPSFMATENLLNQLNALPEAPWSECGKEGLTGHRLARLLRQFQVKPNTHAEGMKGGERRRGYQTAPIRRAWEVYVANLDSPEPPGESVQTVQSVQPHNLHASHASNGGTVENESEPEPEGAALADLF